MNRRDFLKLSGLVAAGLMAPRKDIYWPDGVMVSVPVLRDRIALTIDDGWRKSELEEMLELLAQLDFRATFFLVKQGLSHLADIRLFIDFKAGGHEIGYHSKHHPQMYVMNAKSTPSWERDYLSWVKYAHEVGGDSLMDIVRTYARAPWGYFHPNFRTMCENKGLDQIGWSVDPYDLKRGRLLVAGDIMLLHSRRSDYRWLPYLRDNFEGEVVTLRELQVEAAVDKLHGHYHLIHNRMR